LFGNNRFDPADLIALPQHHLDAVGMSCAFGENPLHMSARERAGALILFEHDIYQRADFDFISILTVHGAPFGAIRLPSAFAEIHLMQPQYFFERIRLHSIINEKMGSGASTWLTFLDSGLANLR